MKPRNLCQTLLLLVALAGTSFAASPPLLINYQGVLRDNLDAPLTGSKDMVFRFYSLDPGGTLLLTDSHTAAGANAVTVSAGLFSSQLGGGTISAGASASLSDLFRDNATVYLEVQVGAETLSPRTKIVAAAYALNASNLEGKPASGFIDTTAAYQTKAGGLEVNNLRASGNTYGVVSDGTLAGGVFYDSNNTGAAYIGYGDTGIDASGYAGGGHFRSAGSGGEAFVGYGNYGIDASGTSTGGHFKDSNSSGEAFVGYGEEGIAAFGTFSGGYFKDSNGSGQANVGFGDLGITASGIQAGGYFQDNDSGGFAFVGTGYDGIHGTGATGGTSNNAGYFNTQSSGSTEAYLVNWNNAVGGTGVIGYGNFHGGYFQNTLTSAGATLGDATYSILGTGTGNFVQNHPFDKERVIVYTSPEGDEVATYTRGTAKLVNGEARVKLGETFKWVTNPDIGLTAQVTPRGQLAALWVEAVSTTNLIVRGPTGSDVTFDFMVYGLRIGFEETSVVQEKHVEERIPSMVDHRKRFEEHPELRQYDALQRYERMDSDMKGTDAVTSVRDMTASKALHDAIEEYDPAVHGPVPRPEYDAMKAGEKDPGYADAGDESRMIGRVAATAVPSRVGERVGGASVPPVRVLESGLTTVVRVNETAEEGDVLVADVRHPGFYKKGDVANDPAVVGIVSVQDAGTSTADVFAHVALAGVIPCKVDAGYGAIQVGDLLVVSPTAGHAMRSADVMKPGTVLGKALESLDSGTGAIKVLVMAR